MQSDVQQAELEIRSTVDKLCAILQQIAVIDPDSLIRLYRKLKTVEDTNLSDGLTNEEIVIACKLAMMALCDVALLP